MRYLAFILTLFMTPQVWAGIHFDNADDRLTTSAQIDEIDTSAFSGCIWVVHDASNSDETLMSSTDVFGNDGIFLWRDDVDGGGPDVDEYKIIIYDSADTDSAQVVSASGASAVGTLTHVCFTCTLSSATGLRLYINGSEVAAGASSTSSIADVQDDSGNPFEIGNTNASTTRDLDGVVTEAALWSVALSDAEIATLYSARVKRLPCQIQSANLVAYWALDEGADGDSANNVAIEPPCGVITINGDDGANNTGLGWEAEPYFSYP